jgi:hypothetical protein
MLPILWAHDRTRPPIGFVEAADDGTLKFRFNDDVRVSEQALFDIFGDGVGVCVADMEVMPDGTRLIKAGQIMEFSLGA